MKDKKVVEIIGQELTNIVNVYGLVYKVPARFNWLAIDCLGEMFAFEEKPVLDEEEGRWWNENEKVFRGGRYIGEFYEDSRYYKTLHYIGNGKEKESE